MRGKDAPHANIKFLVDYFRNGELDQMPSTTNRGVATVRRITSIILILLCSFIAVEMAKAAPYRKPVPQRAIDRMNKLIHLAREGKKAEVCRYIDPRRGRKKYSDGTSVYDEIFNFLKTFKNPLTVRDDCVEDEGVYFFWQEHAALEMNKNLIVLGIIGD